MKEQTVKINLGDILPKPHRCNTCGKEHNILPLNSRGQKALLNDYYDGWFFECSCGSSMFIKITQEVL